MLRAFGFTFSILMLLASCGTEVVQDNSDSVVVDSVMTSVTHTPAEIPAIYTDLKAQLAKLTFPKWIHTDSAFGSNIALSHEDAMKLFPPAFGIPDEVNVYAIAQHEVEPFVHALWFRMEVQGSENKDIWIVLYNKDAPSVAHLAATKGVGLGYAKIDSPTFMREVFIDKGDKTMVTTKTVAIGKGNFGISDEQTSTFGPDNQADDKAKDVADKFFQ